jgi:hypothetical protein
LGAGRHGEYDREKRGQTSLKVFIGNP